MKWKGYGPHKWLWEPKNNVKNAKEAVEEFHNKNPTKPKPCHTWNQKIKIPMTLFPQELFCPLPESLTEPTYQKHDSSLCMNRSSCPREGVML